MNTDAMQRLKSIIEELHSNPNADRTDLKRQFAAIAHTAGPEEIAFAEQAAIEHGIPVESVRQLCDVHLDMFVDDARERRTELPAGHPVSIMYDEHDILLGALRRARHALSPDDGSSPAQTAVVDAMSRLIPVLENADRNFVKQENAFFPVVERHGITQPPAIMWSEHDMMRGLFKELLETGGSDHARSAGILLEAEEILAAHVKKEETILFQAALGMFSEQEWAQVRRDFDELGYVHDQVADYESAPADSSPGVSAAGAASESERIDLDTGSLAATELVSLFRTLPVDITVVDAEDRVAFFSESADRIFPRARSVIGRTVQNCHPPKSVAIVQEILASFRSGRSDSEEFYFHHGEKYIHIRYFAMRDPDGTYLGCLEVAQNLAPLQSISGEKRLIG